VVRLLNIRYGRSDDRNTVLNLWLLCFPDDSEYAGFFLNHLYRPETVLLAFAGEKAAGMAHILPCTIRGPGGTVCNARYIYAVATHPNFRNRGVCSVLIKRILADMYENNEPVALLKPASDSLFNYYRRFGFVPVFTQPKHVHPRVEMRTANSNDISELCHIYNNATAGIPAVERPREWWELFFKECEATKCSVHLGNGVYCVTDCQGAVRETAGNRDWPSRRVPYASARLTDVKAAQVWASMQSQAVIDTLCPWNHDSSARITVEECTEQVLAGGYMNLMHD
jgi:ribosomal protein S18 acetylase RimI-like enzyme